MKKIIVSILLLVTVVCGAFAADGIDPNPVTNSVYGAMADPYMPMSARMLGMGSAGLAAPSRSDAFLINPAVQAAQVQSDSVLAGLGGLLLSLGASLSGAGWAVVLACAALAVMAGSVAYLLRAPIRL